MKLEPRYYQVDCVNSIYKYFETKNGNPLCVLPTGTGKSVIIAMFLESIYKFFPRQKIMVLTHVKELIEQNYLKLVNLWPQAPAGIISAGLGKKEFGMSITFAGIGSVSKHANAIGHIDLIIIDEAHLVSPSSHTLYQKFIADLKDINPAIKIIGLTATPWRLKQGLLTEGNDALFTDICYDNSSADAFNQLIDAGYLAPLIPRKTTHYINVDSVRTVAGDYDKKQLSQVTDVDSVTQAALSETLQFGEDRQHWLVFCISVEHAIHVADKLNEMGISAVAVHSKMGKQERDDAIADFKSGKYRAVTNNNVLTTGFDFPAIDLIVMLRPTKSSSLWVQMLGRGTRPCQGKTNCLVLDFAGNTARLGAINAPMIPVHKDKNKGGGIAPVKVCFSCATYNHTKATHCINCGQEFPKQTTKITQQASTQELILKTEVVVKEYDVYSIRYSTHKKMGRPDSLKIEYLCGADKFTDYVCLEHVGFARNMAIKWWSERSTLPIPESVTNALDVVSTIKLPTSIRVWINNKYPKILAYCYNGSHFGERQEGEIKTPKIDIVKPAIFDKHYSSDEVYPF